VVPDEDLEEEALSVLEAGERGDITLLAPDSVEPEFWNVLWQRHRKSKLSLDEMLDYWDAFEESPLLMGEVLPLMPLAIEIATHSECIIYDALFVALAESEDTVVMTADNKLLRALKGGGVLRSHIRESGYLSRNPGEEVIGHHALGVRAPTACAAFWPPSLGRLGHSKRHREARR
jgi:predicted nucleic acid-binding protein